MEREGDEDARKTMMEERDGRLKDRLLPTQEEAAALPLLKPLFAGHRDLLLGTFAHLLPSIQLLMFKAYGTWPPLHHTTDEKTEREWL